MKRKNQAFKEKEKDLNMPRKRVTFKTRYGRVSFLVRTKRRRRR